MATRILFVGGGSLGHITPSIAVLHALKHTNTKIEALFICSNRTDETSFLQAEGIAYVTMPSTRLGLAFPYNFVKSCVQSVRILQAFKADCIFSKGGYISVPMCLVAWCKQIPIVLHESDVVTGRANKVVSLLAKKICLGLRKPRNAKEIFTGNPIRNSVLAASNDSFAKLGIPNNRPVMYVSGGSQGSVAINTALYASLQHILTFCTVLHVTGRGKQETIQLPEDLKPYYKSWEFIQTELADCYNVATIAITRASANTITELAACKIPIVAVPLRHVGHDHQQKNAEYLEKIQAGICIQQTELEHFLQSELPKLLTNQENRTTFQKNLQALYAKDSANIIAEQVLQEIHVQADKK